MNYKKAGQTHYIKWHLNDNLSLRFYFSFQDRKNSENKYFLKTHSNKNYQEIESDTIIKELISVSIKTEEIIARRTEDGGYVKLIFPNLNLTDFYRIDEKHIPVDNNLSNNT